MQEAAAPHSERRKQARTIKADSDDALRGAVFKAISRNAARQLPKHGEKQGNARPKPGQSATIQLDASTTSWLNENVGGQLKRGIERNSCKMELAASDTRHAAEALYCDRADPAGHLEY